MPKSKRNMINNNLKQNGQCSLKEKYFQNLDIERDTAVGLDWLISSDIQMLITVGRPSGSRLKERRFQNLDREIDTAVGLDWLISWDIRMLITAGRPSGNGLKGFLDGPSVKCNDSRRAFLFFCAYVCKRRGRLFNSWGNTLSARTHTHKSPKPKRTQIKNYNKNRNKSAWKWTVMILNVWLPPSGHSAWTLDESVEKQRHHCWSKQKTLKTYAWAR